jgi:hypothetical protein
LHDDEMQNISKRLAFELSTDSTTLRDYAHAMPLEDETVADDIDAMLGAVDLPAGPGGGPPSS